MVWGLAANLAVNMWPVPCNSGLLRSRAWMLFPVTVRYRRVPFKAMLTKERISMNPFMVLEQ